MSISPTMFEDACQVNERRDCARKKLLWVALVYFGQGNWGKLMDLSENGASFEFAQLPSQVERINFKFEAMGRLPASLTGELISDSFEAAGQIQWTREFERTSGVQFVDLAESSREQIRKWLSLAGCAETAPASEKTEHNAPVSLPEELEDLPSAPETPHKIEEDELRLDAESADPGAELLADLTFPRAEKTLEASTSQAHREVIAAEQSQEQNFSPNLWTSRNKWMGVIVGLLVLAAIGMARMVEPPWTYNSEAIERTASPVASQDKPTGAEYRAVSTGLRPFLVEVLDANNRRWFLSFRDDSSKPSAPHDANRSAPPNSTVFLKRSSGQQHSAASAKPAGPHTFTLIAPRVSQSGLSHSTVNPASIAAPAIRGELPIPVEAPITDIQTNRMIPETTAGPTFVGGQVQAARLVKSVPPVYPAIARSNRQNGDVTLDALIDAAGNVTKVSVISGPALLREAAIEAVRQWKYEPARLDGRAVPMHLSVTVRFRIG